MSDPASYPAEPTSPAPMNADCECAPSPPASSAEGQTGIEMVVSAQDAGLTADVNVVNLGALGLFDASGHSGFDADVSATIAGASLGDGSVLPILGDCGLLGAELPGLTSLDLPDLDLCSLTQQIGL
jgi:hypothetical protein